MNRLLRSAALLTVLASAGCATSPTADRYIAPPQGSTWVSARADTGSFGSATVQVPGKRSEKTWQGRQYIAFESPEATLLALPSGDWVGMVKGDTPLITWDPPLSWDWPLEVGKSWTRKYKMTIHAAKRTAAYEVSQKVEAYEDVTVRAGTFRAFKIATSTTLGDESVVWFSPELGIFVKQSLRRTAKHSAGPGTREIELVSQSIRR